jgi:uncharacterized protein YkwD
MFAVFSLKQSLPSFGILFWIYFWFLLCQQDSNGEDRGGEQKISVAFYGEMASRQFAEREELQAAIDPRHFNAPLLSAAIFHRTNRVRSQHHLKPLIFNASVADAAQRHAERMARKEYLSHGSSLNEIILTPYERLRNAGLRPHFSAENIAFKFLFHYQSGKPVYAREENSETVYSHEPGGKRLQPYTYAEFARAVVQQWMDSPGHRNVLLSQEATQLGVGCALSPSRNGVDRIFCDQDYFAPFPPETLRQSN